MSRRYGIQTKPVRRSLEVLDLADAVECIQGSTVPRTSSSPFCVKLRKGFEVFAPDGHLFIRSATKLHAAASLAKAILAAKKKAERKGYPASVKLEDGRWK